MLTHGWPGSVLEFLDVIEPLSADYHLVIPSLPGYGFSGKPAAAKWSVEHIAAGWDALMRALGYDRYFAQGGDWGSAVTCAIGMNHGDHCAGIHVNMIVGQPDLALMADLTDAEKLYLARFGWYQAKDNGYSTQQATRPQTIGYALADSPVGQMCWIVEKFHGWTDCGHQPGGQSVGGHPERALSKDAMLDTVSLYWFTASAASSARLYWHSFRSFAAGRSRCRPAAACSRTRSCACRAAGPKSAIATSSIGTRSIAAAISRRGSSPSFSRARSGRRLRK